MNLTANQRGILIADLVMKQAAEKKVKAGTLVRCPCNTILHKNLEEQ